MELYMYNLIKLFKRCALIVAVLNIFACPAISADHYDSAGKKTGSTRENSSGGYDVYDASGIKTGSVRQ